METNFEVIVLGAGASGLSAAILLGDKEIKTLVIGDGRSQLNNAWVGNYLGFEENFVGADLIETGKRQIAKRNIPLVEDRVTEIVHTDEQITVRTESGAYNAQYLILATGQGPMIATAQLAGVELVENNEPFTKQQIKINERNHTSLKNVFATGTAAGVSSQAIVAAGHGAQTALNLISERAGERTHVHQGVPKK